MIVLDTAKWDISSAKAFLNCRGGKIHWSFHIFGGEGLVPDEDIEEPPYFYSDYFAPLSRDAVKPFDAFGALSIENGDEFDANDGTVVFGIYVGTHEATRRNRLRFGNVVNNSVQLTWQGLAPLALGRFDGEYQFSIDCLLQYTGMQVKETSEADAQSLLRAIDPIRKYSLQPGKNGAFNLVPE